MWFRNALRAHADPSFSLSDICAVLPAVAYYFVTGPWRSTWVRFGYDPRRHPEAKIYQTLDVRLRRRKYSSFPILNHSFSFGFAICQICMTMLPVLSMLKLVFVVCMTLLIELCISDCTHVLSAA